MAASHCFGDHVGSLHLHQAHNMFVDFAAPLSFKIAVKLFLILRW